MTYEKSCGAVLFRDAPDGREYLVLHSTQGHYTLCKGHVESGETEHETAVREIREETGLTAAFCAGFRERIVYAPYPNCQKEVIFFLAKAGAEDIRVQPEEVADAAFYPFAQACARLTYDSDRAVLQRAEMFLSGE